MESTPKPGRSARQVVPAPKSLARALRRSSLGSRSLPFMALGVVALAAGRWYWPVPSDPELPAIVVALPSRGLPVEINARVEKWMKRFMTDQKQVFETFLGRESVYDDLVRQKLRDRGMPEDLLYLAMIESGFSPRATSVDSAAGMWQFMGPTALQFGLRVDEWVDERRDPVKATDAALDYLEWLHDRYDSWYLAAAAYNAGYNRVDRELAAHADGRIGDEDIYWEIIDHLPSETREYVPKILAATALARQAERYGFEVKAGAPYRYDRVWVPGGTSLARVAQLLGLEPSAMRELNPHLVLGWTPPGMVYGLRVPKGSSNRLIAGLNRRPQPIRVEAALPTVPPLPQVPTERIG